MSKYIRRVIAKEIHGRFNYECEFHDGVNIIFGKNGTGKTTLIHIIANLLDGDYWRFEHLNFGQVKLEFNDGDPIKLERRLSPRPDETESQLWLNGERLSKPDELGASNTQRRWELQLKLLLDRVDDRESSELLPTLQDPKAVPSAYFPAFRTMIDAWAVGQDEARLRSSASRASTQRLTSKNKTEFARELFGQFVPNIEYPSTAEIERQLNAQIRSGLAHVSQADRTHFSKVPSRILELLSTDLKDFGNTTEMLAEIRSLSQKFQNYPIQSQSGQVWGQLGSTVRTLSHNPEGERVANIVLSAYREALAAIVETQEDSFRQTNRFFDAVNSFFDGKRIEIGANSANPAIASPSVTLRFGDGSRSPSHFGEALSSGERQVLTLIYAASQMTREEIVLVDEPEISLHVDWQRKLLPAMQAQMPAKQLVVFTHSPIIGARYRDQQMELHPTFSTAG